MYQQTVGSGGFALGYAESLGSELDLAGRFFAADVHDSPPLRESPGDLQEQGGLSGARRPTYQGQASGDDSAADDRIELRHTGMNAGDFPTVDPVKRNGAARCLPRCGSRVARSRRRDRKGSFVEGVPSFALRATPEPARRFETAGIAKIYRARFGHTDAS